MNFKEKLNYIYSTRTSDSEFANPFLLYCRLSDLCGSSFEDKRKVLLFYQVDKKLNMVNSILSKDDEILKKHAEVADLLSESSFYALIKSVKEVVYPELKQDQKPQPPPQNKVVPKVVITKAEEPEENETRTPLTNPYLAKADNDVIIGLSVMGGILFAIALLVTLACVFSWPWAFWQWFIGIVGGGILAGILITVVFTLNDSLIIDFYVLGTFVLGASILINFILVLILKGNYKTMFGCFSIFELIGGVILTIASFDDYESEWGSAQIVEIIVAVILFIIAMIWI